jgi:hypothetical protein
MGMQYFVLIAHDMLGKPWGISCCKGTSKFLKCNAINNVYEVDAAC